MRKFSRECLAGYAPGAFSPEAAELEMLDLSGKVLSLPWRTVKWVCYVRELQADSGDLSNPERLLRRRFASRPRTPGVWLRMILLDGEEIEGLAANDRSLIEGAGLMLIPPDTRSNTQRLFVPRTAIQTLEVVGLIGSAPRKQQPASPVAEQPDLFPEKQDTA